MSIKALDIFNAYHQNKLPPGGGYIISAFFNPTSLYAKFEIIAYNQVNSIHLYKEGLTFHSDGQKIFILVEPEIYPHKSVEPYKRQVKDQIPHRFAELEIFITSDQTKILISKNPIITYVAFTILKPIDNDFSFFFYNSNDVCNIISNFFELTLCNELKIQKTDAKKAADLIQKKMKTLCLETNK